MSKLIPAMTDEEKQELMAAIAIVERRHPGCGWTVSRTIPTALSWQTGEACRRGVTIYHHTEPQIVHEDRRRTLMECAATACDRLDRRLRGETWA